MTQLQVPKGYKLVPIDDDEEKPKESQPQPEPKTETAAPKPKEVVDQPKEAEAKPADKPKSEKPQEAKTQPKPEAKEEKATAPIDQISQNPHVITPTGDEVPKSLSALIGMEDEEDNQPMMPPQMIPTYGPQPISPFIPINPYQQMAPVMAPQAFYGYGQVNPGAPEVIPADAYQSTKSY